MLYHGTALTISWKVIMDGFKISEGGQLGAGCYLAREDKASRFAIGSRDREKGIFCVFLDEISYDFWCVCF